ncbi:endonuclease domain-containing protein [Sphingomonas sp. RHCKR47]|uniref:endonuclease domain-containing protein n=1 Tax=Sphingomonas citricola TaxID=2862498 RepID=UPI001C679BCB|nr:endonuclease domain-containing protein [Sphingomonas citricola]MBW6522829.1 endonuclease domain-containing protein [Sphingomonas citricola]
MSADETLRRAKAMRSEMTQPERELWTALRAHRFNGVKFSRQVVVGPYILDFAARSRKLVIEVDGDSHAGNEARDERRTAWLEEQGYHVIRFSNADVMRNMEGVLFVVEEALRAAPLPTLSPQGEGFSR